MSETSKPWLRRADLKETEKAYAAFAYYRDQRDNRSFRKTSKHLKIHQKTIERWAKVYQWFKRATEFDNEDHERVLQRTENDRVEMYMKAQRIALGMMGFGASQLQALSTYLKDETIQRKLLLRYPDLARVYAGDGFDMLLKAIGSPEQQGNQVEVTINVGIRPKEAPPQPESEEPKDETPSSE